MQMIDARQLVADQIADGKTVKQVAQAIGYNRSSLSLFLHGHYPAKSTGKIEAAIISTFTDHVLCPHLREVISRDACGCYATRPLPQSDAAEFKHWLACQSCPIKPPKGEA